MRAYTGSSSTAVGAQAMSNSSSNSGDNNTAIGAGALNANAGGASNTAVGSSALTSNTTASNNTAVGYQAGYNLTSGNGQNVAIGQAALYSASSSTGYQNIAIGANTLILNTTGFCNVAIGSPDYLSTDPALYRNTTGYRNVGIGSGSLNSNTTGFLNTAIGWQSLASVTTGSKNTCLGSYNGNQGGLDIRTSSNYIVLSDGDGNPRQVINNNAYFGFNTSDFSTQNGNVGYLYAWSGTNNNIVSTYTTSTVNRYGTFEFRRTGRTNSARASQFGIGENASSQGEVYAYSSAANADLSGGVTLNNGATSWAAISDARLKNVTGTYSNALADIANIEPIKFTWKSDTSNTPQVGVIAQSVENVVPEAIGRAKNIAVPEDDTEYLSVRYTELIPIMIASIQELKALVDAQATEIAELKGK